MSDEAYPVTHGEAEWRRILTPEQYEIMQSHGTEAPGSCALLLEKRPGKFCAPGAVSRYLRQTRRSRAAPAGRASTIQSRTRSRHRLIEAMVWSEPKFIAQIVGAISDTFLTMARHRAICATALTGSR
jgi:hypothetical protein